MLSGNTEQSYALLLRFNAMQLILPEILLLESFHTGLNWSEKVQKLVQTYKHPAFAFPSLQIKRFITYRPHNRNLVGFSLSFDFMIQLARPDCSSSAISVVSNVLCLEPLSDGLPTVAMGTQAPKLSVVRSLISECNHLKLVAPPHRQQLIELQVWT